MTTSTPPFIECEQIHAGPAASEIPAAIDFYTKKLGFKLGFTWGDPPTFAGVNLGKVQIFLQKGTPDHSPPHSGAQENTRHRLRQPWELPVRRGMTG